MRNNELVKQRLIILIVLAGLILATIFLIGFQPQDSTNGAPSTPTANAPSGENSSLEDVAVENGNAALHPAEQKNGGSTIERSAWNPAAVVIDVVLEDLTTPAPLFDLFLVQSDKSVEVLQNRSQAVDLNNSSEAEYVFARGASGWSKLRPVAASVELDGTPHLLLALDQPSVSFHVNTSSSDGVTTAAAQMTLLSANEVAQKFLGSDLGSREMVANEEGSFSRDGLPPALYTAKLRLAAHVPASLSIDLAENSSQDLTLVFAPAGFAVGRVTFHQNGLADATVALLPADFQDNIFGLELDNFRSIGEIPNSIPEHHKTHSDASGNFQFSNAAPGDYQILVAAPNFLPRVATQKITISAHETTTCEDLELAHGFGIDLIVVDAKELPVADVAVSWYRSAGSNIVEAQRRRRGKDQKTDLDGKLHIGGLPAELLTLEFHHADFAQVVLAHDFSGRSKEATEALKVVLQPGAAVAGSVVDGRTGMPIEKVHLELHTSENNQAFGALIRGTDWDAESSQDGNFSFSHLPPGEYILIAKHENFAEVSKGPFVVAESAVENLAVMMHPGALLIVSVLDSEGVGIADATVQAVNTEAQQIKTGTTDEEGIARLENISPGNYQVAFTDISSFDTTSNSGSLDVSFKFIKIEEGEELEITLGGPVRSAVVEGVVRRGGELQSKAMVAVITDAGVKVDTSDEAGAFRIEAVPLGDFVILVRSSAVAIGGSVFYDSIHIAEEGTQHHDIDMPHDGVKIIVVSSAEHKPLANIPVSVRPMDASNISGGDFGISDNDGVAEFPSLPSGEYIIAAGNATASFMATSEAGFGSKQKSHVSIQEGSGIQIIEMSLDLGATFKVQVSDPDGNLLAGAHMHYLDAEGQPLNILSFNGTNSKGVAQMDGLPSGPGYIWVRHPQLGSKEIAVNLTAGSESKQKVQLERGTVIYVTTTNAEGLPISGVLSAALDSRGAPLSYLWSQEETQATNAAFFSTGAQRLGPLPNGEYIIQLYRPGNPPVKHKVTVNGQGEMHLSLPYSTQ